ncbi:hypothetical protein DY000_02039504 [Brassica cretica]|uniref:Uncharacterized protein n=1 Tax=Brassica cretica TaxID=69181 RepID=A0ABQ7BLV0_BRACR|nr:hypothetical protein DY000_02039504 [Brassica cretica]
MCAGDQIYFENLGSIIKEHRPCHFRLSTIGGVTPEVLLLIPRSYLDPVVMWEPGGSPIDHEIVSGPGGHDQEVEQGPGGRLGTRRFLQNLRSYLGSGGRFEPRGCSGPEGRLGTRRFLLDPEVILNPKVSVGPRGHFKPGGCSGPGGRFELGGPEIFSGHEEFLGTRRFLITRGTVLRLPRQDYSQYLFGFHILLLGSWPLLSSYDVFYFCRKSLAGLEGAGVGVMTQVPGFAAFHVWRRRVLIAPCTFHNGTLGTPMRLRLHMGFRNWHVSYDAPCVRHQRVDEDASLVQARSLRSDRAPARARSLRNDRAEWALGCHVVTELWLEIGRYVATERSTGLVAA